MAPVLVDLSVRESPAAGGTGCTGGTFTNTEETRDPDPTEKGTLFEPYWR